MRQPTKQPNRSTWASFKLALPTPQTQTSRTALEKVSPSSRANTRLTLFLVCHEDDILLVFGNSLSGTTLSMQQQAVQKEVMARWTNFIKTGSPNAPSYATWNPVKTATNLNMLLIGNNQATSIISGTSSVVQSYDYQACEQVWGIQVPFDVQMFPSSLSS
jgi:hypothetical protein